MACPKRGVLLLLLVSATALVAVARTGYAEDRERGQRTREREEEKEEYGGERGIFMLHQPKQLMKTEAGVVRVLRGYRGKGITSPMHIGFITMEPKSVFVPQYIDANLILFVRQGEMKVGWIYKDKMVEKDLKSGDVYRIPAGSAFYLLNIADGQRLQLICSIDTTESIGNEIFQSFFIAGGSYPTSVLAGFDAETLCTAFNVSEDGLSTIMKKQRRGPIVYVPGSQQPSKKWNPFLKLKQDSQVSDDDDEVEEEEEVQNWSWRKLLNTVLGKPKKSNTVSSPDAYNLYEKKPDFKNDYGWSLALDQHDYAPLKRSGIGIYLVNLTAGAMMAPHVNPLATEYGVILRGSGTIQVVFPNGTSAMNVNVKEGDAFWVPRYFPFCQIASRSGPMEFFGFTTSARRNRPQFLVGSSSVLQSMKGAELAIAFDVSQERLEKLISAQSESIILPSWPIPPKQEDNRPSLKTMLDGAMGWY